MTLEDILKSMEPTQADKAAYREQILRRAALSPEELWREDTERLQRNMFRREIRITLPDA